MFFWNFCCIIIDSHTKIGQNTEYKAVISLLQFAQQILTNYANEIRKQRLKLDNASDRIRQRRKGLVGID